jgi:integrase/recombinase XerD
MDTPTLVFKRARHRGSVVIQIHFPYNRTWIDRAKQLGAIWSRQMNCWYVPDTSENRKKFNVEESAKPSDGFQMMSEDNKHALSLFIQQLTLKGYSPNTLTTYKNEFTQLLVTLKQKHVDTLNHQKLKDYFDWCITHEKLSESTVHSRLNAVKFYFEQVLDGTKFFWNIPRPKKPLKLPKVISEEKLLAGLLTIENLKHRALLFTAYSAGLRVSEVVSLKVTDIDSDRMQIRIEAAKGKKDRMATLAKATLEILREYAKEYKPKQYLFAGQREGEPYSARSAQQVFNKVFKSMGLPSTISFHSLRHSYATHLFENGIDIKYIQELLGHNDIRTTLRYTHVSNKQLGKIESPLDTIMRKKD